MNLALRRAPAVTKLLVIIGVPAFALGLPLVLTTRNCEGLECIPQILGVYLLTWSPFALLAAIPNRFGFFGVVGAATILAFWAVRFPGAPVPLVLALPVVWLTLNSRERIKAHYFGDGERA